MSDRMFYMRQLCNAPEGKPQKEVGSNMANNNNMEKRNPKWRL